MSNTTTIHTEYFGDLTLAAPQRSTVALGVLATFIFYYLFNSIKQSRKGKLPPGPPGLPIVGNLFQLSRDAWYSFTDWQVKYGDIIYISVAGQGVLILNSFKVAADLLDRRAGIYSSRVRTIVAGEILTGGMLIPFQPYGDLWRRMRRAAHEGLSPSAARNFWPSQEKEACLLVDGMLAENLDWQNEVNRATFSMTAGYVYDLPTIDSCHDPIITYGNNFIGRIVRSGFPGAHFVEFFPWMKYLPSSIAKWKREAEYWFKSDGEYYGKMYKEVEKRIEAGDERISFTSIIHQDAKHSGITYTEKVWLAATIFNTGAETTNTGMAWFVLAMVWNPEVQKTAQAHIDAVVGRDRMPTFADRDNLPYIVALVRETLRWRTLSPVAVPHLLTEDDWYEGYYIPKGTICIANAWAMNRDTRIYGEDIDAFRPERFLDEAGQLKPLHPDLQQEGHASYGFGRRICVGRHVSNNSMYIDIASMLWGTWIENAPGAPMPDNVSMLDDGLVVRPVPFPCKITPRFPEVADIVARTKELTKDN